MSSKLILYLPVIHQGYLKVIKDNPKAEILIIDKSVIEFVDEEFDYLRKEIRAITPEEALTSLQALLPKVKASLLTKAELEKLNSDKESLVLPKEDIFIWLAEKHLPEAKVEFADTFLRWDKNNSTAKKTIEGAAKVSKAAIDKKMMALATKESGLSSDWWRQVGGVVVKGGKNSKAGGKKVLFMTRNKHLPTPYAPYVGGDPRNAFSKGKNIELSTSIHAEASMIAQAAKEGVSLDGAEMYVTTFPCPPCAKLIAVSGIKKLYFKEGYAMTDGKSVLENAEVEIVRIAD